MHKIVLAGGCFWGIEEYFRRIKGIHNTRVGYAQGKSENPSYKDVCSGDTGHIEVCEVAFDENIISLEKILNHLFSVIDPTSLNKQGGDVGTQYRTGIFVNNEVDLKFAQEYIVKMQKEYQNKIVVEVAFLDTFYNAEDYHQKYLVKNPSGYCHINLRQIPEYELKDEYK